MFCFVIVPCAVIATKSPRSPNRGVPIPAQGGATRATANRRATLGVGMQAESAEPNAWSPSGQHRGRNERSSHFGLVELRANGSRVARPMRSFGRNPGLRNIRCAHVAAPSGFNSAAPLGNAVKHFRAPYKARKEKMVTRRVSEGCTRARVESQFIPR